MSNVCLFLNTRILSSRMSPSGPTKESGALAWIGDKALAPVRCLFNGKTVIVFTDELGKISVQHSPSFIKDFYRHRDPDSSSSGMIKTALSIVFLIPGLILGIAFKGLAYLFSDVRERHWFARLHFTPINRVIGSSDHPITSSKELSEALKREKDSKPHNPPTDALIIHGNGKFGINEDPGILDFNPMKLILKGTCLVHGPSVFRNPLEKEMDCSKWQITSSYPLNKSDAPYYNPKEANPYNVHSIEDALECRAPLRSLSPYRCYHLVFQLPLQGQA